MSLSFEFEEENSLLCDMKSIVCLVARAKDESKEKLPLWDICIWIFSRGQPFVGMVGGITSFRNWVLMHQNQALLATLQWVWLIARFAFSFFIFFWFFLSLFVRFHIKSSCSLWGIKGEVDVLYYSTLSRRKQKVVAYWFPTISLSLSLSIFISFERIKEVGSSN